MTGPEHYSAAEQLLLTAQNGGGNPAELERIIDRANVHALLALVAATALGSVAPQRWTETIA